MSGHLVLVRTSLTFHCCPIIAQFRLNQDRRMKILKRHFYKVCLNSEADYVQIPAEIGH